MEKMLLQFGFKPTNVENVFKKGSEYEVRITSNNSVVLINRTPRGRYLGETELSLDNLEKELSVKFRKVMEEA
jgi:hypothetical protein